MAPTDSPAEFDAARQPSDEFVRLFLAHEARLYGFVATLVPNRADADEVFQEMGLTVWKKFADFAPGTDFVAWACRVAQNHALNHYTKSRRSKVAFDSAFVEAVGQEFLARREELDSRRMALDGCLEKLRPRDRQLLADAYEGDRTVQALAIASGRPADTLYKALKRIRQSLHDCITRALAREASS